jgi:DNA (cytosine-5)-methyltransferase 1
MSTSNAKDAKKLIVEVMSMKMDHYSSGIIVPNPEKEETGWSMENGIARPQHLISRWPVAVDLFAECGGMSLGLMQAGFHVKAAADNDPAAALTYMHNLGAYPCKFVFMDPEDEKGFEKLLRREMGYNRKTKTISQAFISGSGWRTSNSTIPGCEVFFLGDIRKLTGERILKEIGMQRGEVDLVCGGPPCQGFSNAGKRNVMDPRNSLVFDFARIVLEIFPKTMMMENVPGIVSMVTLEGLPVMDTLARILQDGNFGLADALKKSLLASSGMGAAVRQGENNNDKNRHKRSKKDDGKQMVLGEI